jgi:hypothetical protein
VRHERLDQGLCARRHRALGSRVVASSQGDIAIFRTADDQVFALHDKCPHKGGPLSQGIVHGETVTCPLHGWKVGLGWGGGGAGQGLRAPLRGQARGGAVWLQLTKRFDSRHRRITSQEDFPTWCLGGLLSRSWKRNESTCCYCGVGCGVIIEHDATQITGVRGDPDHPANFGRLCTKGGTLHLTVTPQAWRSACCIRNCGATRPRARTRQLGRRARPCRGARFAQIIREHGPDSVAFYISGQLLTEDYYVFNKLAKGLIGTNNVDTNSRLCMSPRRWPATRPRWAPMRRPAPTRTSITPTAC